VTGRELTLGLFAKFPERGLVKSRLAAATSSEWAAEVADALIRDSVERFSTITSRRVLVYSPADHSSYFAEISRDRFAIAPQDEGDLGARLERFISAEFQQGADRVVVLGTDSPTVPLDFVERAFRELDRADVVLGPATDGGYYLVGCAQPTPAIFRNIPWGSHAVLKVTIDRLRETSSRLALLPPWYDIDTVEDWQALCGHVAAMRLAGINPQLHFLERLMN
jgi:uncharacterized protein